MFCLFVCDKLDSAFGHITASHHQQFDLFPGAETMKKTRTEEQEVTARLLNHMDEDEVDENGPQVDHLSYELKSRSRIRNGTSTINPLVGSLNQEVDVNQHKPKRRVYTDQGMNSHLFEFVEWPVKPGDTLSSLSLKSGCTIAHIKRANNLISDQDFYALSVIRIPVKRYSILSQVLVPGSETGPGSGNVTKDAVPQVGTADLLGLYDKDDAHDINVTGSDDPAVDDLSDAEKFIQNVDKEVTHIREKVTSDNRTARPTTSLTLSNSEIPIHVPATPPASVTSPSFNCDGADGGLTIIHVLILVLVICIVVPVIYVFLAEEHQIEMHQNHSLTH